MTKHVRFGDVVRNVNETANSNELLNFEKVIGLEHLDPGELKVSRWAEMNSLSDGTTFRRIFRPGQVLFGKRRAYQRKVALASFEGICSSDILVFDSKSERLLSEFLPYIVQSDAFFEHALQTSSGSLSPRTRWEDLSNFEFELPSLEQQERVVEMLTTIDKHLSCLDYVQQSSMRYRNSFLDEEMTNFGRSWRKGVLSDFAEINPSTPALNSGSPFVPMDAVHAGERFVKYFESRGSRSGCRAKGGDVLFARITPCLENGKTAQVPRETVSCGGSTEFIVLRESSDVLADFLFLWATWPRIRAEAASRMIGTTGRQRISAQSLGEIGLYLPPIKEQIQIINQVQKLDDATSRIIDARRATQQLRTATLNKELS